MKNNTKYLREILKMKINDFFKILCLALLLEIIITLVVLLRFPSFEWSYRFWTLSWQGILERYPIMVTTLLVALYLKNRNNT